MLTSCHRSVYDELMNTPNPQTIPCDIVLLPDNAQSALALQASQLLAPQGGLTVLDNQNFYAHASLYMFQMALDNVETCVAALQKLAANSTPQQLAQAGYYYLDSGFGKGYVDIGFSQNTAVNDLQHRVIAVFNELRSGMRESDKNKMSDASGLKLENLQQYGYPSIGELFRPHITLTKFPAEIEPDLSVLPPASGFTGGFARLGLFEMGANGTCIRQIAAFELGAAAEPQV